MKGENKEIVNIKNILCIDDEVKIIGTKFKNLQKFYEIPCNSSDLNIFLSSQESSLQCWPLSQVSQKCFKIKYKNKFVIMPLLHTNH